MLVVTTPRKESPPLAMKGNRQKLIAVAAEETVVPVPTQYGIDIVAQNLTPLDTILGSHYLCSIVVHFADVIGIGRSAQKSAADVLATFSIRQAPATSQGVHEAVQRTQDDAVGVKPQSTEISQ